MKTITRFFAIVAISLAAVSAFAQPTAAPTAPISRSALSVISIYGTDTYTPITGVNTFPDWGQFGQGSTATTYTIAGTTHNVLKYGKLSYQGIDFTGNAKDVSGMQKLHLDIWTADAAATPLSIAIINGNSNIAVSKTITTNGTWTSLDILLTEFTGQNLTAINQLMFKSAEWSTYATNALPKDIYVDNIYFWTDVVPSLTVSASSVAIAQPANSTGSFNVTATQNWNAASDQTWLGVAPASGTSAGATLTLTATANPSTATRTATVTVTGSTDATVKTVTVTQAGLPVPASPTPTVASANVKSIYSDFYTPAVTVTEWSIWWTMTFSDYTLASGGTAKLVVADAAGSCGSPTFGGTPLDITGTGKMHIDIYPLSGISSINYKLVTVAHGEAAFPLTSSLTLNTWNSIDVTLSGISSYTDLKQVGIINNLGSGTFYIDNLFFYSGTTGINDVSAAPALKCFMNSGKLNVSSPSEMSEVTVRNLLGQNVRTATVNANSKTIELSGLASGNYIVVAKMSDGQISTQKFVKF